MAKVANKRVGDDAVMFDFIDGESLTCGLDALTGEIIHRLALHGLSQKVGDSYAGAESVEEAREMAKATFDNLIAGAWAVKASRGGKVVEAMVRASGKDYAECLEVWNGLDEAAKKDLRKHPHIKQAIAEIDLERAKAGMKGNTDGGADLSGLFD